MLFKGKFLSFRTIGVAQIKFDIQAGVCKECLVIYHVVWFSDSHKHPHKETVYKLMSIWKCVYCSLNNCKLKQTQVVNSLSVSWLLPSLAISLADTEKRSLPHSWCSVVIRADHIKKITSHLSSYLSLCLAELKYHSASHY